MIHLLFTQRAEVFHFARDQQQAINLDFIHAGFIHAKFVLWAIAESENFFVKGLVAHDWPSLWTCECQCEQARVLAG